MDTDFWFMKLDWPGRSCFELWRKGREEIHADSQLAVSHACELPAQSLRATAALENG